MSSMEQQILDSFDELKEILISRLNTTESKLMKRLHYGFIKHSYDVQTSFLKKIQSHLESNENLDGMVVGEALISSIKESLAEFELGLMKVNVLVKAKADLMDFVKEKEINE